MAISMMMASRPFLALKRWHKVADKKAAITSPEVHGASNPP
jgi:hypothetical protein